MTDQAQALTEQQLQHFLEKGYVVIEGCFSREAAKQWTDLAFKRLGYDPDDPSTWIEAKVHLPVMNRVEVKSFAPKAHAAICELVGGEDRIAGPIGWGDGFIINFALGADRPWVGPSAQVGGWHKDGDFFRHFLDSPEQGLLTIVVWSDIEHQGGGTFMAPDSIGHVARMLAEHPEGLLPNEFSFGSLIERCEEFVEFTAKTGDVALIHPYMLHAASQNVSGKPRFITNPPVSLREPMNFNSGDAADYSPVERAVLRALGAERFDFQPTAPRERVIPERVGRQKKMLEEQKQRLGAG